MTEDLDEPRRNRFLPISLDMEEKKIILVGGGRTALQKLRVLRQYAGTVKIVALKACREILEAGFTVRLKPYDEAELADADLVYACTGDSALNRRIRDDARARHLLVNVVDDPALSDFVSPAIFKRGPMTVAVGSDAIDVKRSIAWRDRIGRQFDNDDA